MEAVKFIIIDSLGGRKGTIKAETRFKALEIYLGFIPSIEVALQYKVIHENVKEIFKKNIKNLK